MRPVQVIQQHSDHLAAWLTFAGALLVAVIAAITAHIRLTWQLDAEAGRLRRQLEAESERLARQLEAESERLARQLDADAVRHRDQLSFQRGETDRAELRSILDALAAHVFAASDAAEQVSFLMPRYPALPALHETQLNEERDRLDREANAIATEIRRVALRLASDDLELVRRASDVELNAKRVRWRSFPPFPTPQDPDEERRLEEQRSDEIRDLVATIRQSRDAFSVEALKFTGAKLHSGEL